MTKNENGMQSEFQRFDAALSKVLSVSHNELVCREEKWKKQRKRKRQNAKKR
jgi:hypothetical protein